MSTLWVFLYLVLNACLAFRHYNDIEMQLGQGLGIPKPLDIRVVITKYSEIVEVRTSEVVKRMDSVKHFPTF